jgi:hypothetical protein
MTESPAQTLRRAAEKLHGLAQAAIDAGWTGRTRIEHAGATNVPIIVSADSAHARGVADVMNGAYASLLATLGNPTMGLLIADTWDEIANVTAFEERMSGTASPGSIAARALPAARAVLGEEADAA